MYSQVWAYSVGFTKPSLRIRKTRDPLTPPLIAKTQLQQQHWQHQTTTTTTTSTTTAATTRSRHRNGSQVLFGVWTSKTPFPPTKLDLAGVGEGGEIRPFFQKAILLFLVYVCKNGFRMDFGHVGVQKTVVLVAKNGFEKMIFLGRRFVFTRFTNVANSENPFSCGFLRMERFNLALPDVIMVATWMLCGNGWSLWERYHGCHMDALWEWIEFVGMSSWLPHGCSVGMDGVSSGHYHGWDMDALREWIEFVGTSSGLPHGCSAGMDGVCGNVIMVATWMLCGSG